MSQMNPMIMSQLAAEKRREMLARAERDRLASQLRGMARASRRAGRAQRTMQKAARLTLRLRSDPFSQAVRSNGLTYLSGLVAEDPSITASARPGTSCGMRTWTCRCPVRARSGCGSTSPASIRPTRRAARHALSDRAVPDPESGRRRHYRRGRGSCRSGAARWAAWVCFAAAGQLWGNGRDTQAGAQLRSCRVRQRDGALGGHHGPLCS
jgi:hypothetical protein